MNSGNVVPELAGKTSAFYTRFIMNAGDGLIISLSLATGLYAATMVSANIFFICLTIIVAVAVIMTFAAGLAARIEKKHFETELQEQYQRKEDEKEIRLLESIGLGKDFQAMALGEISKDRQHWEKLVESLQYKENAGKRQNLNAAFSTGFSLLAAGVLPILPYLLPVETGIAFKISAFISFPCLLVLGYLKSFLVGAKPWAGAFSMLFYGVFAAAGAYLVAFVFV